MTLTLSQKTNVGFSIALTFILAAGLQAFFATEAFIDASHARSRSLWRMQAAMRLMSSLKDAESGQRGFLLTHRAPYLQPYLEASAHVDRDFEELAAAYADAPEFHDMIRELGTASTHKLSELTKTIELAQTQDIEAALAVMNTDVGKQYMDQARQRVTLILQHEHDFNAHNDRRLQAAIRSSGSHVALASSIAFLILLGAAVFVNKDRQVRQRVERDLLRANESAEQAAQAKSTFLSTMSHEIRTPLNGITGMSDLLMETPLNAEQRHFADVLHRSAQALLHIVNDILDFSKIDAGKLELERIQFHLVNTVESQLDIVSEQGEKKGLSLLTYIDPALNNYYWGDPGRISQILLNLLSNALKFTTHGSIVVRVTRATDAQSGASRVRFAVQDTGTGIDASTQERLFRPFSQAAASTARQHGGTGLGLAICKMLTEMMGGTLTLNSRLGAGSTFFFELPLAAVSPAEVHEPIALVRSEKLAGLRALVVDDDPVACDIMLRYMHAWGLVVHTAADGSAALATLQEANTEGKPFEVLFVDKVMPGMDGMVLARNVAAQQTLGQTQPLMVLMSGFERAWARSAYSKAGFVAFLPKPFKQSQLFDCLVALRYGEGSGAAAVSRRAAKVAAPTGKLILVAEDNAVNQLLVTKLLERLGHKAHVVGNGREALEAIGRVRYDLLLMDCQMPEMDGYEATRRIRDDEHNSRTHLPILALTANAIAGDAEKCLAAGMDDYLTKPLKKSRLEQTINKWLAG